MKSLVNKLVIYDSNCKVCSSLKDVVVRLTSIPDANVKAFKDLDPPLSNQVDPERFKNVMALIDTAGGRTLYGAEGVAYIFSRQYKLADFLLRSKIIFQLFNFGYKTLAYNRYIVATPKSKFICDCFPDRVVKYRVSYILVTSLIAVILTALFGIAFRRYISNDSPLNAAMQMLIMAGTGWVLQILLAIGVLKEKALDYIGHLGTIMVAGVLVLIPAMLISALSAVTTPWIPAISLLISSGYMLYLHIKRVRYLSLSQGWTFSWFFLTQLTALCWFVYLLETR